MHVVLCAYLPFDVHLALPPWHLVDDPCSAGSRSMDDAPGEELLGWMLRVQNSLVYVPVG